MKKRNKIASAALAAVMTLSLAACSSGTAQTTSTLAADPAPDSKTYKVGICNFVDDASLNQIVENIQNQLKDQMGDSVEILYDNCNTDAAVLNQIIANFIAEDVDVMVGVATPVAMAMQAATEDNKIPVIFAAVSDPEGAKVVESNDHPGGNLTGTSDYLDTTAVMNLIFAADPDASKIGLLYDAGQESSATAIAGARAYLQEKGVQIVEHTGTTVDEVMLAAQAMVTDKVDAIFTPQDNTVMTAELAIYETLAEAGIPHYTGADSFALNGAFLGYGVDYANLGVETANMVLQVLSGADPATLPVKTFDNGTATVNIETCEVLGYDYAAIEAAFAPLCTKVQTITTAESFS